MKRTPAMLSNTVCALMVSVAVPTLAASPAIQLQSVGNVFATEGQFTLGFEFMVSEELRLVTLGVFDAGQDGLESPAQVSLWMDDTAGTLLASTEVPSGAAALLDGDFRHVAISPVTLTPGVLYVVGAYTGMGLATAFNTGTGSSTGSVDSRLSWLADRYWSDFSVGGNGNDFPLDSEGHVGGAWLGASFQLSPVPEPATAGLLATGLLAAALRRRLHRAPGTALRPG